MGSEARSGLRGYLQNPGTVPGLSPDELEREADEAIAEVRAERARQPELAATRE